MNVVDLMTTDVITVRGDDNLKTAAQLMFRNRVSGLPVIDADDRVVGMITEADFLELQVERFLPAHAPDEPHPPMTETAGKVDDIMTSGVITVPHDMEVAEAARIMSSQEIKRLPVVDDDARLIGIISRMDVVAAFTRPDEVIEDEIREDLIRRVMFIDPDDIAVTVRNGIVTLGGEIGTRNEASLLGELTRRLDGVVGVDNHLSWRLDDGGS